MYDKIWAIISEGRRTSRPEGEGIIVWMEEVGGNSAIGFWLLRRIGIFKGCAISTFQLD
jgi:hypothetical protein